MTQDEILQYNKRCALFLGAIYSEAAEAWGFGNAKNIGSKMFQGVMYHNVIEAERFEKELKFHSDWNWMMEVVEAIEKLIFNVRITIACVTIENAFDNNSNLSPIYKFHSIQGEFQTKKEAVVQAINQFLIWYEQSMKTSKSCK